VLPPGLRRYSRAQSAVPAATSGFFLHFPRPASLVRGADGVRPPFGTGPERRYSDRSGGTVEFGPCSTASLYRQRSKGNGRRNLSPWHWAGDRLEQIAQRPL